MKYVIRVIFGRPIDSVFLTASISLILLLATVFVELSAWIRVGGCVVIFLDTVYFSRALWWKRRKGKEIFGYLRFDNILEIHIADASSLEFSRKLRKTIRYAQQHSHYIEFTSGMIPYGSAIQRFGNALVSIRTLGLLGRIWNGGLSYTYVKGKYDTSHPIKIVIDPSKLIRSSSTPSILQV